MDENSAVLSQDAIDALLNSKAPDDSGDPADTAETPSAEAAPEEAAVAEAAPEETAPAAEETPAPVAPTEPPADPNAESTPAVAPPAPAPVVEATPPAAAPVTISAPPPPGVTPPPGVVHAERPPAADASPPEPDVAEGVSEEQAMMIAGEAAEAAVAPVVSEISLVSGRLDALEAAMAKIRALESEIESLKAKPPGGGGLDLEALMPLIERVKELERGAKNSPLFNLYDKLTCSSCDNHGAGQARVRCGKCGKEGWFGRKEAA